MDSEEELAKGKYERRWEIWLIIILSIIFSLLY